MAGTKDKMPVWAKPLLTLEEASIYTGIGINKLREWVTGDAERARLLTLHVGATKRLYWREEMIGLLREEGRI